MNRLPFCCNILWLFLSASFLIISLTVDASSGAGLDQNLTSTLPGITNSSAKWSNTTSHGSTYTRIFPASVSESKSNFSLSSVPQSLTAIRSPSTTTSSVASEYLHASTMSKTIANGTITFVNASFHQTLPTNFTSLAISNTTAGTTLPTTQCSGSSCAPHMLPNYTVATNKTGTIVSTTIASSRNSTSAQNISTPSQNNSRIPVADAHKQSTLTDIKLPSPKAVFAHYLVGTVTADHANQDIDEAMAMGLDGFALNIGDPSASFLAVSLDNIFGYAEYVGFKLFISMDVYASGNACYDGSTGACGGPIAYETILKGRLGSTSWYKGPNGLPMISTYSSGGALGGDPISVWNQWKEDFASVMYFVPDYDETAGYYTADPGWFAYWGDLVDGVFSWESAWPYRSGFGGAYAGDVSPDLPVQAEMQENNKTYMLPLSTLQYKNSYGANVYRAGELNLPTRMQNILSMATPPDFVQIVTWNDGPEGHYIGNLWLEQNNDTAPMKYANQVDFPHNAWQPLITSFITAYKNGDPASAMAPPSGTIAVGAMWYKTILQSSVCPDAPNSGLYNASKPDGFDTGADQLNYGLVLPSGASGYQLRAISNGDILQTIDLNPGLNSGYFTGVLAGSQRMELLQDGAVVLAATGGRCISAGCPDCVYNMNPQVVGFLEDTGSDGTCPYQNCKKKVFAHYMVGNVYEDHAHQDIDDAAALGLDGFALNVGDPTPSYVRQTFDYMFDYARDNHPDFKFFISLDLWAEGNAFNAVEIDQYTELLRDFLGHDAWLLGPNGHPFISTYSSGGMTNTEWTAWKEQWANAMYFVPDIDDTAGYNTSDPGWWEYWGDTVDGVMSWETAWPKPGIEAAGNIDTDMVIITGTYEHRKSYMMPLSTLQYKNSYNTNYYRQGDLSLPKRMEEILNMPVTPDFIQYLTWNDGPESHYIGNIWEEQNNDTQPGLYANQQDWNHTGWQPLLASFTTAFKSELPASSMTTPNGELAVGALWYKTILQRTVCPTNNDSDSSEYQYTLKPNGFESGTDQLNWAVVLPPTSKGLSIHLISNGEIISNVPVVSGLNYGSATGVQEGQQRLELVDLTDTVLLAASGGRCIATNCPDCIYNMNPQVVPLIEDTGATGSCPDQECLIVYVGDGDDGFGTEDYELCDYSLVFDSLDDLYASTDDLRSDCIAAYSIQVLINMLDTAYANYTNVTNGYDDLFPYYVTYIKKLVPEILANDFMWNMSTTGDYAIVPNVGYGMNYFNCELGDSDDTQIPCSEVNQTKYNNDLGEHTTTITLTDSDGYNAGLIEAGVPLDWVDFGDYEIDRAISAPHGGRTYKFKFTGFPVGNSTMVVPNPQDIVTEGLGSFPDLRTSMEATLLDIMLGQWSNGTLSDAAQVYSVPVFMLMQAVDAMAQAKVLGAEEKKEEAEEEKRKKDFILLIVSVILMFVPVVGEELAAAAGFASLARAITIAGEVGNGALTIYDTVEDPNSAVVNVLGMLVGVGAIAKVSRDGEGLSSVAKIRKSMTSDDVSILGTLFKANDDKLQSILKVCRLS